MNDKNYCVILAGGIGMKLWPSSTHQKPKQFIDFLGTGETLLQSTYKRITRFVDENNIIVSTNEQYRDLVVDQLPQLHAENLLLEPMRRNTLPSATWATVKIAHRCSDARILVVPSDQMIYDEDHFEEDIVKAFNYVSHSGRLLALGVMPTHPATNYGYIQMDGQQDKDIYQVKSFTEKPELDFAQLFVDDRGFLWNTGLFVWNAKDFLRYAHEKEVEFPMIDMTEGMVGNGSKVEEIVKDAFSICPNISIEQVCLEKTEHTDVMLCHFRWSDLGTWHSLYDTMEKDGDMNVVMGGNVMLYDCNGCMVKAENDKVVVAEDLRDYLIVEENNVLLICHKSNQNAIRRFVNDIQINMGDKFV